LGKTAPAARTARFLLMINMSRSKFKFRTFWRRTASGTAGIFSPRRSVVM
jgi:hypothetical protein